jgi:hypothetical protein
MNWDILEEEMTLPGNTLSVFAALMQKASQA